MTSVVWTVIVVALIALCGTIYLAHLSKSVNKTLNVSVKNAKKVDEIPLKLGVMSAETQGKQMLSETVSFQRGQWINNIRDFIQPVQ